MPLFQLCGDEAAEARSKYYLFPSPQAGILILIFGQQIREISMCKLFCGGVATSYSLSSARHFKFWFWEENPRNFVIVLVAVSLLPLPLASGRHFTF